MSNIYILLLILFVSMYVPLIVYQERLIKLKKEFHELEKRYNDDVLKIRIQERIREQERQRNAIKEYVGPMQYVYKLNIDSKGKESINLVALPTLNQVTVARNYGDIYSNVSDKISVWR